MSPCTPWDSTASSHTPETCFSRLSGPGASFCYQVGSGCLAAKVTRAKGGARWAVAKSSRDGMAITTSRPGLRPHPPLMLAVLRSPALWSARFEHVLRSLRASLGDRPAPDPLARSPPSPVTRTT